MNVSLRGAPLVFGYEWTTTYWPRFSLGNVYLVISLAIMLWIVLLQLFNSFEGSSGAEHETLCTSNVCLTLHMDRVSFKKAGQNCVHNGGNLMTVRNLKEEDALLSLLSRIPRQPRDRLLTFWIGLKLHRGDCVLAHKSLKGFSWVSGQKDSNYSNWGKEPVNTCTEERCAKVYYTPSGQNQLKWTAGPCRNPSFYACKFYFQGMCRPLALLGSGEITYKVPFSEEPQRSEMQLFPLGTYADVSCSDRQSHYSVCLGNDDSWTAPGPFCATGTRHCAQNNGGCEHLCRQDADEVRCFCKEGYDLDENGLTCRMKAACGPETCEHQCVTRESGYSCTCPDGFQLDANLRNCSDIDECQTQACAHHLCLNTRGGYTCACRAGYAVVDAVCVDIDECARPSCEHGCSNGAGSFSCSCNDGFALSEDGHSCVDINECASRLCQFQCVNAEGSFWCTCPRGFHVEADGSTCAPDGTETSAASSDDATGDAAAGDTASSIDVASDDMASEDVASIDVALVDVASDDVASEDVASIDVVSIDVASEDVAFDDVASDDAAEEETQENISRTTAELQHPPHRNDTMILELVNDTQGGQQSNSSLVTGFAKTVDSRVLVCVLGSVIPLLLLLAVTLAIAIVRCNRSKREAKKRTTADGYCWVPSGLDSRLEKLYESILTDDL
ncbi:Complement component C1q receptor [Liparis tanakae]|uniref:Complement component C1q receptor n=1 Tax=Liparis tanakae TaxID=230148 RepID=A0A4Z2HWF4_9TELE|nr:Complement component C1q receptor [Liparis tanakae]